MDIKNVKTKEYYKNLYEERINNLYEYFRGQGQTDPGYCATIEFDKTGTAEEVAGYYICNEGDNALKQWYENTEYLKEKGDFDKQDEEVEVILKTLYKTKKYRVFANSISKVYLDVYADSEEEAKGIADKVDGGNYTPTPYGSWEITEIKVID